MSPLLGTCWLDAFMSTPAWCLGRCWCAFSAVLVPASCPTSRGLLSLFVGPALLWSDPCAPTWQAEGPTLTQGLGPPGDSVSGHFPPPAQQCPFCSILNVAGSGPLASLGLAFPQPVCRRRARHRHLSSLSSGRHVLRGFLFG